MQEMKENRACVAKIDETLEGYSSRVEEIKNEVVNRQELIDYFKLNSDDPEEIEEGLKQMWQRVGMLQNAMISAESSGNDKDRFEFAVEISVIRELRTEVNERLASLKAKG